MSQTPLTNNLLHSLVTPPPCKVSQFYDLERDGVTQGLLTKWLLCREKARLGGINGLVPLGRKEAMEFGNVIHMNLDEVYTFFQQHVNANQQQTLQLSDIAHCSQQVMSRQEWNAHQALIGAVTPQGDADDIESTYAIAAEVLQAYFYQWQSDFDGSVEWVALEQEFSVPYFPQHNDVNAGKKYPINLRGKIDGVRRDKQTGKLWLFETKSKGVIDADSIASRLSFELQTGIYMYAMSQLYGEEPVGLIYNLIRRPLLRRKVNESLSAFVGRVRDDLVGRPEHYFKRMEVAITPTEIDSFRKNLYHILREFLCWYFGAIGHYQNPASCYNGVFSCEFLPICADRDLSNFGIREFVYPELEEKVFADAQVAQP